MIETGIDQSMAVKTVGNARVGESSGSWRKSAYRRGGTEDGVKLRDAEKRVIPLTSRQIRDSDAEIQVVFVCNHAVYTEDAASANILPGEGNVPKTRAVIGPDH